MSITLELQKKYDELNPLRNLVSENIQIINRIEDIIENTLPYLKARLEANVIEADSLGLFSEEAKAEVVLSIAKAEKTIAVNRIDVIKEDVIKVVK